MYSNRYSAVGQISLVLAACAAAASTPLGSPAPDFTIADQYDHPVRLSSLRGKPVLVIYGDRVGSSFMGAWARAVKTETAAAGVDVIEAANLKTVPGFMHAYVKHKFLGKNAKGDPASPVLLDWDGRIASTYGFHDGLTNVYVIDAQGTFRFWAAGKGTAEETRPLAEVLQALNSPADTNGGPRQR